MNHPINTQGGKFIGSTAVVTSIFFIFGFITSLNDVLIPHLKSLFTLDYTKVMLIQFTFFGAYLLTSIPCGKIIARIGYKYSNSLGLLVSGVGAMLFYPASYLGIFGLFLGALFILAAGITMMHVAANPYITLLGDPETASSRLNLAQAFNSLGTTVGPLFGGLLILSGEVLNNDQKSSLSPEALSNYTIAQAHAVQLPYLCIAAVLICVALIIFLWKMPSFRQQAAVKGERSKEPFFKVLAHRPLRYAVIALFLYVGAEVALGSFMINYIAQPEIGNLTASQAAHYLSFYWGGAMIGRFLGALLMRKITDYKLLGAFAIVAFSLVIITVVTSGTISMWSILAVGLFNSIMFPTIYSLGLKNMGELTGRASSFLSMAIGGGAIFPLLQGAFATHIGLHMSYLLPACSYLFIAWFAFVGRRIKGKSVLASQASLNIA